MKVKEYKLFKTAQKTAYENGLEVAKKKSNKDSMRLFDFSELNGCLLNEEEIDLIKNESFSHICSAFSDCYYGKEFNAFNACDGVASYYCHRVYGKSGKLLYRIFQLVSINHTRLERKSIYNNYTPITIDMSIGYDKPMKDYEI